MSEQPDYLEAVLTRAIEAIDAQGQQHMCTVAQNECPVCAQYESDAHILDSLASLVQAYREADEAKAAAWAAASPNATSYDLREFELARSMARDALLSFCLRGAPTPPPNDDKRGTNG